MQQENNNAVDKLSLRAARIHYGLTQAEVGRIIGTSDVTLSRWERGIIKPPKWRLMQLTELYGISPEKIGPPRELRKTHMIPQRKPVKGGPAGPLA